MRTDRRTDRLTDERTYMKKANRHFFRLMRKRTHGYVGKVSFFPNTRSIFVCNIHISAVCNVLFFDITALMIIVFAGV